MKFKKSFLYGMASACLCTALSCTPVHALTLEQLSTDSTSIDVYFHDDGVDLSSLSSGQITATLDGTEITITDFEQTKQRLNYIFLLDISRSVSEEYMTAAKQEILHIYENLNEQDLLSIITFGTEVHTVLNGTETLDEVRTILDGIHCEDWYTHFYDAVDLMLEQLEDVSDMHNIAVVVSDGINTGDASTTLDSLKTRFSGSGITLYALAVDTAEPAAISSFREFVEVSGGQLFTFSPDSCDQAMEDLLLSVDSVWNVGLEVAPELITGQSQLLEIQIGDHGTLEREVILEARELDVTPPTITEWTVDQTNKTLALHFSEAMADLKDPEHYRITNADQEQVPVTVLEYEESYVLLSIEGLNETPGWSADFVRLMDASANRNVLQSETLLLTPAVVVATPEPTLEPATPTPAAPTQTPAVSTDPTDFDAKLFQFAEFLFTYWYIFVGVLLLLLVLILWQIARLIRRSAKERIELTEEELTDEELAALEDEDNPSALLSARMASRKNGVSSQNDDLEYVDLEEEEAEIHVNSQIHDRHIPTSKGDGKKGKQKEFDPDVEVDKVSQHRKSPKIKRARKLWFLWKQKEEIPEVQDEITEETEATEETTTPAEEQLDDKTIRKYVKPKKTWFKKNIIPTAERPASEGEAAEGDTGDTTAADVSNADSTKNAKTTKKKSKAKSKPAEEATAPKSTLNASGTSVKSGGFALTGISTRNQTSIFQLSIKPENKLKDVIYKTPVKPRSLATKQKRAEQYNKRLTTQMLNTKAKAKTKDNYNSSKPKNIHFTFTGDNQKK